MSLLVALGIGVAFARQTYQPNAFDLVLIYYQRSGLPIPWHDLAQHFDDYRRARNEFDRQEMLSKIKPIIEREMQLVADRDLLLFPTSVNIGEYEFGSGAFPLSITPLMYSEFSTRIPGPPPAILFLNADKFTTWALPRDEARQLLATLRGARTLAADIEYRPVRAREGSLNWKTYRIIDVEIVKIALSTPDKRIPIAVLVP